MIQIDSVGTAHVVGKNPHLVTLTPEREDNVLKVNDILSIGRRDREPWMRLQVVRKSNNGKQLSPTKKKTHTPEWMTKQTSRSGTNPTTPRNPSRAKLAGDNPPEWITTTRKRKSSSASRQAKQQRTKADTNGSNLDSESNMPCRKRRRTRESADMKGSRPRSNRRSKDDANIDAQKSDKYRASAAATSAEKDRHPQVHLVFQDYETSANLVRATQRRKKRRSSTKVDNSSNTSGCVPSSMAGEASENACAEANQLKLFSRNFAAALLSNVSPANELQLDKSAQKATPKLTSSTETRDEIRKGQSQSTPGHQEEIGGPGNDAMTAGKGTTAPPLFQNIDISKWQKQVEESLLSLPQCESAVNLKDGGSVFPLPHFGAYSLESGHGESFASKGNPVNSETNNAQNDHLQPKFSAPSDTDLRPWQDIIKEEEEKGQADSFRHAFASLVVAKNKKLRNDGGISWLPTLLEEHFHMPE